MKFKNVSQSAVILAGQTIEPAGEYLCGDTEYNRLVADATTMGLLGGGILVANDDFHDLSVSQVAVQKIIAEAINFGTKLISFYAADNVLLGITQAGMTTFVRTAMAGVVSALGTGSLYEAIDLAKATPAGDKDGTFINDARLLQFVNKIETYLGITLSTTL